MNIIKWLKSRNGKLALTAMQKAAVAAAGVVGVGGVVAYQMFSSPAVNPDTMVSYQDEDVVYVAGASGGAYQGINYQAEGTQSGIQVSARNIRLNERLEREDALRMQEKPQAVGFQGEEQKVQAYKMDGASTGLGLAGQDKGEEIPFGNGNMSQVQAQIDAVKAMTDQKAAEAAAQAAGAQGSIAEAAQAALARSGKGYNMNSGINTKGGNAFNSTPTQAGAARGGTLGGANAREADRLAMADRASMGNTSGFGSSRDEYLKAQYQGKYSNSLAGMAKQSADLAGRKDLAANAGAGVFMNGGGRGVATINDNGGLSLGGAESLDGVDEAMRALGITGEGANGKTYAEAKKEMIDELVKLRDILAGVASIPIIGPVFASISYTNFLKKLDKYKKDWGETVMEKEDSRGAFSEHAKSLADKMYGACWGWLAGTTAIMVIHQQYEDKYWPKASKSTEEKDPYSVSGTHEQW